MSVPCVSSEFLVRLVINLVPPPILPVRRHLGRELFAVILREFTCHVRMSDLKQICFKIISLMRHVARLSFELSIFSLDSHIFISPRV